MKQYTITFTEVEREALLLALGHSWDRMTGEQLTALEQVRPKISLASPSHQTRGDT